MAEVVELETPEEPRPDARRRWRVAVAVAVVASLVSGAAGYWLGQQDGGDEADEIVVGDGDGDDDADDAEASAVAASPGAGGSSGGWSSGPPAPERAASTSMVTDQGFAPAMTPLLARTARDGTLIRVLESRWPTEQAAPPEGDVGVEGDDGGWRPPPQCQAVGNLEIGLTTDVYTASGWSEIFGQHDGPAALWGGGWTGHPQLGPILFAAVRVTDEVSAVQLVQSGAVVDESAPTEGWVVLAAQLPAGDPTSDGEVVVLGNGGKELARRSANSPAVPYNKAECQPPPPTLPDEVRRAGESDAEAVEAIQAAFAGAFGRSVEGRPDARPFVQSGDRLDDAFFDELRQRTTDLGIESVRAVVPEVGFADDGAAIVVFQLEGAPLGWMFGEAVAVDGTWKVTDQTWCALVEMAGVTCPSGMRDPNRGPSRYDQYETVAEEEIRG